jgi:hypothetical protein
VPIEFTRNNPNIKTYIKKGKIMKNTNIKFLLIFTCFIVIIFSACNHKSTSRYNENPDLTNKVVGSKEGFIDRWSLDSFDDVLYSANCVIIGEVIEDDIVEFTHGLGMNIAKEMLLKQLLAKLQKMMLYLIDNLEVPVQILNKQR